MLIKVILGLAFISCNNSSNDNRTYPEFNFDTTTLKTGEVYYQCPMDLEILSSHADQCPKCNMDLEKRENI